MTVGKHVASEDALLCRSIFICINKPANCGIVIATLQIVELSIRIVVIPTIPQRIHIRHAAGDILGLAVWVVMIVGHFMSRTIDQLCDIPLEVGDIVIGNGTGGAV